MVGVSDDGSRRASVWLFGPAVAWALACVLGIVATAFDDTAWSAVDRRTSTVVGSVRCRDCHPAQHQSWWRSYHRTMTQPAQGDAVLAPFAGETLERLGFVATMTRRQGQPHVRIERVDPLPGQQTVVLDVDVEFTVGSHRYQQYVARMDRGGGPGERFRIPVAWHVELGRWIHLGDAFLTPEGAYGEADDYLRHLSRWNDNCIFCHNTEPVPGKTEQGQWDSRVGELGIACEACHGPASAHVERHAWPLRRLLAAASDDRGSGDGSVAHPGRLSAQLHADVCGRCHGNRIAADLEAVLRDGDGFVPGHPLAEVSRPILRDASLAGQPGKPFAPRFWPDGTPRLSAYEYQALQLSPCASPGQGQGQGQGLGCGDCHTMHGPEPSMQLWPDYDAATVCARCHDGHALSDAQLPGGHGRHGDAVGCDGCHLPRVTYGLLEGMMSHRITRPRPQDLVGRDDQPDACTQCHVGRTRTWAAQAATRWPGVEEPTSAPSRVAKDLHGGDPIARALAAHALARPRVPFDPRARMAWLVDALRDDYPAVRWFGYRGLEALARRHGDAVVTELLAAPGSMEDPGLRTLMVQQLAEHLGPGPQVHVQSL